MTGVSLRRVAVPRRSTTTPNAKLQFIKWLEDLEYGENKIPKEDLVIFLSVPVEVSQKLMDDRKLDIHERDASYLKRVVKEYESLARERKNWVRVECLENGRLMTPEVIHKRVLEVLKQKIFIH